MKRRDFLAGALLTSVLLAHPSAGAMSRPYRFAVVPQQPPRTILRAWGPLVTAVATRSGVPLSLEVYPRIRLFEAALAAGAIDFAYMNPLHYVRSSADLGFQALVKARNRRLSGILVVRREDNIRSAAELHGSELAFPAPGAFAASILVRRWLDRQGVNYRPAYVRSHDSVYLNVVRGHFPAGGGVHRTLADQPPEIRERLRVLHETPDYTPHVIAAHPRIPPKQAESVRLALVGLAQDAEGRKILERLHVPGWQAAKDEDWNDVRQLLTEMST